MTSRINPIAPRLKWDVLDPSELERIHEATLEIMEEVGIRFPSDRALTVLEENGCEVDRATQVAKFPRALDPDIDHFGTVAPMRGVISMLWLCCHDLWV